jgi:hypothetical protein
LGVPWRQQSMPNQMNWTFRPSFDAETAESIII